MHKISEIGPMIAGDQQAHDRSVQIHSLRPKLCRRSGLRELVWSYFERNWDIMMERYDMAFTLTEVTKFPAEFHTEYDYQRLSSFFANRDLQSGWRSAYPAASSRLLQASARIERIGNL
uniref:SAM-dependent methyltransferase n=1 Tax=Macrostomum lignano TaxID=282301 RepID=A0A1I8FES7_9PLAT